MGRTNSAWADGSLRNDNDLSDEQELEEEEKTRGTSFVVLTESGNLQNLHANSARDE